MTLAALVPDYDTCLKLKAAGFPQNCALGWELMGECAEQFLYVVPARDFAHLDYHFVNDEMDCAAPTFEEIWAQLPPNIESEEEEDPYWLVFYAWRANPSWYAISYADSDNNTLTTKNCLTNIAQVAADLWLHLHENGLLK